MEFALVIVVNTPGAPIAKNLPNVDKSTEYPYDALLLFIYTSVDSVKGTLLGTSVAIFDHVCDQVLPDNSYMYALFSLGDPIANFVGLSLAIDTDQPKSELEVPVSVFETYVAHSFAELDVAS